MKHATRPGWHSVLTVLLTVCMVIGLFPMNVSAAVPAGSAGIYTIVSQTDYAISPGVTETDLLLNTTNGNEQNKGFLMEIDPSNPNVSLRSCYKNYSGKTWGMQTPTQQAAAAEKVLKQQDENANVVGVINTSFFNMSTGEPSGALVMNGVVYRQSTPGFGYFAVYKDGHVDIDDGSTPIDDSVLEATSGRELLIWDGNLMVTPDNDPDRLPRTAIGITADGKVILYVNDGRQAPVSVGMSVRELAEAMLAFGCVRALNLDGGGSSTFLTEREGTGTLSIKNSVSDGFERAVSSTLLVVSTAKPSGVFDHASLAPNGEYYTPGSSVTFTALGVDSAGVSTELPGDLTWALADASMGTIQPTTGVFTANEKTGPVTVQIKQGGQVVGQTTIHVQAPDKISFLNDSINLKYGERSDLGLTATYQGNTLNIKSGDFNWSIVQKDGNGEAGRMDGDSNIFVASQNNEAHNLSATATVHATSRWNAAVTNSIEVSVGKEPVVVLDGGDSDGHNYDNIAYVHANANGGGLAYETHADDHGDVIVVHYINGDGSSRGGIASAEQVDIDTGKVRFGQKALRLDYDFRNIIGIEGACVGFDHDIEIPGSPTGIGFWCYAPENTVNLWVRIRVRDGSGTIKTLNFTTQSQNVGTPGDDTLLKDWNIGTLGGINWVGWKYIECDLSSVPGPITLMGGETIRIMDTNGGQGDMGTWVCQKDDSGKVVIGPQQIGHQKGYLYIDNLQLVYGTNNADIDNPVIKLLQAGPTLDTAVELSGDGSTVINSNEVTFYSEFKDVENENTSGLDFGYLYLDGKNMSDNENFVSNMNDGKLILNAMKLANGTHTVKVLVHDMYGNEAVVTRTFTVQGDDETLTSVNLEPLDSEAPLGGTYRIAITSNKLEDVQAVAVEMAVNNAAVAGIDWANDYQDSVWQVENGMLKIHAARSENASGSGEGTIGTINLTVANDLDAGSMLTYAVTDGSVTYATEKDSNVVNTFAMPAKRIPVTAAYLVELGVCYEGGEGSEVTVKNADGSAAKFVDVFLKDSAGDRKLGMTDKSGKLATDVLVTLDQFTVYAKGKNGFSFPVTGKRLPAAGAADGSPYYILENATQNAYSTKSISWMANPQKADEKAVIEYALKSEYDQTGKLTNRKEGSSVLRGFIDASALLNNVMITGLETNTEYAYRVGDGTIWSEVRSFETIDNDVDSTTKLFLLGDTQTAVGETDNINKINRYLYNDPKNAGLKDFTLGIQLGDAVEEPALYHSWQGFLDTMELPDGAFGHTDMLHVIGNHEQFADPGATAANAIYAMDPTRNYYSVTYGNVYIATIAFSQERSELEEAAAWLLEDAKASDAPWKILVLHQPPYYTNTEGGSNFVNEILPPVIDEAGIEFVFSGHDHAYARTEPLRNRQVDPDGTYYFICGSTGEKSYGITNNPDFHFAYATQEYEAVFLTITATDNMIDVTAYDLTDIEQDLDGTGPKPVYYQIIDSVHRTRHDPCAEGEHEWVYRPGRDTLLCEKCLARLDKAEYSGIAKVQNTDNDQVYMISGVIQTGWITDNDQMLHAGEDGILHETETVDTHTCTQNGHIESVCKTCGEKYRGAETFAAGHKWDENHVCTVCGKQGIDISTLPYTNVGKVYIADTVGKSIRPTPRVMDGDYELNIKNSALGRDGYVSWERYTQFGTATVIVDGRGDYYGTLRINYDIVPAKVPDVKVDNIGTNSAEFSWSPVPGAEQYAVFAYDYDARAYKEIAATKGAETNLTVAELKSGTEYHMCVKARVMVDGKPYDSYQYEQFTVQTKDSGSGNSSGMPFVDLKENAYYLEPVKWAYENGVTDGTDDTHFSPDGSCTRAQVVTFLWRAENEPKPTITTCPFTDVKEDAYYYDAVMWAVEKGITDGTSDTTFSPNEKVTRGQFVTFLARCAGEDTTATETPFTDVPASAYYVGPVAWAYQAGITDGKTETTFGPNDTCTRAQVVTFLYRHYNPATPAEA